MYPSRSLAVKARLARLRVDLLKYSPDQSRDDHGRFSSDGSAASLLEANEDKSMNADRFRKESMTEAERQAEAQVVKENEAAGTPTNELYSRDGVYTPERQDLHSRIVESMFTPEKVAAATPPPGQKPVLVMTGGRPGAGKTTALRAAHVDNAANAITISADDLQEKLPGYSPRLARIYNGEGQDLAVQAERVARKLGVNVVYDATMKTEKTAIERVKEYEDAGYDVEAHFVHTAPHIAARRSINRFMGGGRYVPPELSFSSRTNERTFDALKPRLRKWTLINGNGNHPSVVARGGRS